MKSKNTINGFTFYKDYFNLIDTLPYDDKSQLAVGILDYVFKDLIPDFEGHNKAIFNTLKHQLDKSKKNSFRSQGNGAPLGNKNACKVQTENKPKTNQIETKNKQNSISNFIFLISNFIFLKDKGLLREKMKEWLEYKTERKDKYTEIGFKKLLSQIETATKEYGEEAVVRIIDESMANNYKGIIFEKLKNQMPITKTIKEDTGWIT